MKNRLISGKTRLCGIIGDPVEHSMSPVMHNAAFEKLGMNYLYVPFSVKRGNLSKAIEGMRALNIKGLNVTIPHKVAVIPYLDELDYLAEKIGAVNTIVNHDNILKGYNTDASGFLQALLANGVKLEKKEIVLLGAGGAARAVAFILAEQRANLIILNRHGAGAKELADRISWSTTKKVMALELNQENLNRALAKADILVNATSVGMSPNVKESPVPYDLLRPELIVSDIVYNPIKTRLLSEAEATGAKTIGGLEMLVWQGALAFELWTGQKAPVDIMQAEAVKQLKGYEN